MKELYAEGLAIHGDPESWDYCREAEGQASTGVHASWPLSREIIQCEVPTPLVRAEGNTRRDVMRAPERPQRGLRPHASVEPSCARTGRTTDCPWVAPRAAKGRRTQCVGSRR
jgi:hypothetical protein